MKPLTQNEINAVNALYKDPETGKGILEGYRVDGNWMRYPNGITVESVVRQAITRLVHKLLEQEQKSGVWIDGKFREVLRESVGACPYCKSGVRREIKCKCGATLASIPFDEHATANEYWCKTSRRFWLAPPPPVVEPEPEWEVEQMLPHDESHADDESHLAILLGGGEAWCELHGKPEWSEDAECCPCLNIILDNMPITKSHNGIYRVTRKQQSQRSKHDGRQ